MGFCMIQCSDQFSLIITQDQYSVVWECNYICLFGLVFGVLPGHLFSLQRLRSVFSPMQGSPPKNGPSHTLCLCWLPPPHVLLQLPQELQESHFPSTTRSKTKMSNFWICNSCRRVFILLGSPKKKKKKSSIVQDVDIPGQSLRKQLLIPRQSPRHSEPP